MSNMNHEDPKLTAELVVMAIHGGMLDEGIEAIKHSVTQRREVLALRRAGELNKGDRFIIRDCSPKKWNGIEVEFTHLDGPWICVNIPDPYDRQLLKQNAIKLRTSHVGTITKTAGA